MKECDVIIPIYNAYDYTKKCIETVLKNTDLSKNRLILINDKSTDERITPLLEEFAKNNSNIVFFNHEKNLGFVKTVNEGMRFSNRDVLLLNSDTEVTPGWLEKIQKCAYSQKRVATVTALSNNATFASVPQCFKGNELPSNFTVEEYGELIEQCSYKEYPEVITAHGFCMYIRREVLDLLGYFDEDTFGRGYGEENDFSFRCLDYGYKNLLCDNVFVYHKEAQSFMSDKALLIENGLENLGKKYPNYKRKLEIWCENFPIKYISKNVLYNQNISGRKNILIIIHDWKDVKNNLGGTTLHVYDLIRKLRDKYNFHVLAPEDGVYKLYSYFSEDESEINLGFTHTYSRFNYYSQEYNNMISNIIDALSISLIHIHHLKLHYFDIIDVAKKKNVHVVMTLHDYYSVCPLINKLYNNLYYCEDGGENRCSLCLKKALDMRNNMVPTWRKEWHNFLKQVDKIIVPSESAKEEMLMTYPGIKLTTIEHGIEIKKIKSNLTIDNLEEYNIAFVGAIGHHKGNEILEKLVLETKNTKIKIHLFGICSSNILVKNRKNFIHHGKYKREELPNLLKENNIRLVCSFSIWPETYSYTLTEIVACGVPVLAIDLGAISERIKKYSLGWLIPLSTSIPDIIKKIENIFKDKEKYEEVINAINKYKIKTTDQMIKEYIPIYDSMTENKKYDMVTLKKIIKESESKEVVKSVDNIQMELILNSLRWKVASAIKVPEFLKKVARKIIK